MVQGGACPPIPLSGHHLLEMIPLLQIENNLETHPGDVVESFHFSFHRLFHLALLMLPLQLFPDSFLNIPRQGRTFLTTDTEQKARCIRNQEPGWTMDGEP